MEDAPQPVIAVYESSGRKDCLERALVLQSAGIPHRVLPAAGGFVLVVAGADAHRAAAELASYEQESLGWTARPAPLHTRAGGWRGGWSGVVVYAALLVLIAILQRQAGSEWLAAGRTRAGLICQGEWWRAVTALTLHANITHLCGNIVIGGLFGLFAGQLLGSGLAWLSILFAGAMGNALNACVQQPEHSSVGASTAVFGALGILAAHAWKQRRDAAVSRARRWIPVIGGVVLLGFLGTGGERTDVIAHLTGFACGLALGALFASLGRRIDFGPRTQLLLGGSALAILGCCWLMALQHGS